MIHRAAPLLLLILAAPAHADERRFMLPGFDRVRVEGPFEVSIVTGPGAGAVASGDRRAIENVAVRVQGTTLIVSTGVNGWGGYPGAARSIPRVTVTATMLQAATVVGGGRVTIDRMRGQRIGLNLTGAGLLTVGDARADRIDATLIGTGRITVAGSALQGRFESNGAGGIEAQQMSVGALRVNWSSAGEGRFLARNTAEVAASGQGPVTVDGTPACTVRGNGPVVCGRK